MKTRSGDFVTDLDIEVSLRSGEIDLATVYKTLERSIVDNLQSMFDAEMMLTEADVRHVFKEDNNLSTIKFKYSIGKSPLKKKTG